MLAEQQQLLADLRDAERTALSLYNGGVKISSIIQKLRGARDELETRVRYLEQNEPKKKPVSKPKEE